MADATEQLGCRNLPCRAPNPMGLSLGPYTGHR
jgi:hypothetical protein